jgi:hypothetical protein
MLVIDRHFLLWFKFVEVLETSFKDFAQLLISVDVFEVFIFWYAIGLAFGFISLSLIPQPGYKLERKVKDLNRTIVRKTFTDNLFGKRKQN